jgi:hypothetical protein
MCRGRSLRRGPPTRTRFALLGAAALAIAIGCGRGAEQEAEPGEQERVQEELAAPEGAPATSATLPAAERERIEGQARRGVSAEERIEALEELGGLGAREAMPVIQASLADPVPEVREAAVEALADLGGDAAIDALGDFLVAERDPELKLDAIDVLESLGGERAATALARGLADPDAEIRYEIAAALAMLEAPGSVGPLLDALRKETDEDVRDTLLDTLEMLGADVEAFRE